MGSREDRTNNPQALGQDPELEDFLRAWGRDLRLKIRTHVPAKLVAFNPATNTAVLSVEILQVVYVTDLTVPKGITSIKGVPPNAEAVLAPVQLFDIPVQWPSTSKGWITFELTPGDEGLLHIADRSIAAWLQKGITTEPVLAFLHALQDSIWYPGALSKARPFVPPVDPAGTVIQGTQIKLGPLAVSTVIKGTEFVALMDAVLAAGVANISPQDGGAKAIAAMQTAWNSGKALIESQKAKTE